VAAPEAKPAAKSDKRSKQTENLSLKAAFYDAAFVSELFVDKSPLLPAGPFV